MTDEYQRYPGTADAPLPLRDTDPEYGSPAHLALLRATPVAQQVSQRRTSRTLLGIGAIIAAATLASSGLSALGTITAVEQTEVAVAAGVPQRLVVEATTASVTVQRGAVDRPTFKYRSAWGGTATLSQAVSDGTLTAQLNAPNAAFGAWYGNSMVVVVPQDAPLPVLAINVNTGAVEVTAAADQTFITSGTGSIEVTANGTDLHATTNTGAVEVTGSVSGVMEVATTTGSVDVELDTAPSQLVMSTQTGSIEAELPTGPYAVTTRTGTGSIDDSLEHDSSSAHQVTATTTTGAIELSTP